MVASIEDQVERLDRARIDDPVTFRANYRAEFAALLARLKTQYPAALVDSYAARPQAVEFMSIAEIEHLTASSAELMTRLAVLAAAGVSTESPEARQGIEEHYRMLTQTVPLSPEAYRSLGKAYREDPLQHSLAAAFSRDLPRWLANAIESYARSGGKRVP